MRQAGLVRDGFPNPDGLLFTWGQYTSTGAAAVLTDGENVASLTKNGTGDVTVTLTNGYRDAAYGGAAGCYRTTSTDVTSVMTLFSTTPFTASSVRVLTFQENGVKKDTPQASFMLFGMP